MCGGPVDLAIRRGRRAGRKGGPFILTAGRAAGYPQTRGPGNPPLGARSARAGRCARRVSRPQRDGGRARRTWGARRRGTGFSAAGVQAARFREGEAPAEPVCRAGSRLGGSLALPDTRKPVLCPPRCSRQRCWCENSPSRTHASLCCAGSRRSRQGRLAQVTAECRRAGVGPLYSGWTASRIGSRHRCQQVPPWPSAGRRAGNHRTNRSRPGCVFARIRGRQVHLAADNFTTEVRVGRKRGTVPIFVAWMPEKWDCPLRQSH